MIIIICFITGHNYCHYTVGQHQYIICSRCGDLYHSTDVEQVYEERTKADDDVSVFN